MSPYYKDPDPQETEDWLASLDGVIENEGEEKADYLLQELTARARAKGLVTSPGILTSYCNSIPPGEEKKIPGDSMVARNVAAFVRWNAMAMVARANKDDKGLGGHIATYTSVSAMYAVGFNWFFRGPQAEFGADMIYFQGHSSPGIYARAFVEGRFTEEHLKNFRQEVDGKGLSSYPHPYLMPDFWQFPTVSMGLGPMAAIYQARFMRYMDGRGLKKAGDRKVWVFMGDGESDEPESLGALTVAAREDLDNLIFVINCNLQRLDGPVRGNGKIIQELEGRFRGAGWNVIKLIWGSEWDRILQRDKDGLLLKKFGSMVDGEFQTIRARGPEYLREKVFGDDPKLQKLVEDISDRELWQMSRGGHDPRKVYAAFAAAVESKDRKISTTMAFVRLLGGLVKDKNIGKHIVPIIPDEARTFGMEGLFRQLGIYAPQGQLYEPQDSETVAWYREDPEGQICEEGITEAGAISTWMAAGTAHNNYGIPMIPFYTFYSMFGFQRVGDQIWAAADAGTKGFLMGATSGRTTLNGEGLQHEDGQGLLLASVVPNCLSYDPTFAYEVAVLIKKGIERMYEKGKDVFYYIALLNENYSHPEMPEGVEEGIDRGMYLYRKGEKKDLRVQLMGSGAIFREVIAAADMLAKDFDIQADVWSVLGINQLHHQGMLVENWNMKHPGETPRRSYIDYEKGKFSWGASGRALSSGAESGSTKALFAKDTGRIIGAAICGQNAGELIHEAVLALEMGANAEDISKTVHAHPTLAETFAFACETVDGSLTDGMPARKK